MKVKKEVLGRIVVAMINLLIFVVLPLLVLAFATKASAAETAPSAYKSLQPFERFAKGAGEGVAYEYKIRTKQQFVSLLRDKKLAESEMRVSCDVLVRQMVEGHPALPFEGCEGAAAAIERDDKFAVVACKDEMFVKDNFLTVTNEDGSAFGVWHRKCLQDEQVLTYEGQVLISLKCLNPAIPMSVTMPPKAAPAALARQVPPIVGACPDVYTLKVNVWKPAAMDLPRVAQTHAQESIEEKFVGVPHISRTHGKQFRDANAKELLWSTTPHEFRVSFIMTPESDGGAPTITSEEVVGDVKVVGMRELRFTLAQLKQWNAIRVIPIVDGNIQSPPRYSKTGLHELRYFNHLPGTKLGEWDDNPVPDCVMNEHWIEQ